MKVLVISDIHGSENWKKVFEENFNEVDHVVFMGDYFDAWKNHWPDQSMNFMDIMSKKKDYPDKVHILWGNHDWSYITCTRSGSCVSGHQHSKALEIRHLLLINFKLIDICFECDGVVFSHAGVSKTWLNEMKDQLHHSLDEKPPKDFPTIWDSAEDYEKAIDALNLKKWDDSKFSLNFLNDYLHRQDHSLDTEYKPDYGFDLMLDWHGHFSSSGDEVSQGPLWIRPKALLSDAAFDKQVVGHTEYCLDKYMKLFSKKTKNKVIVTDSHVHNVYEIIDTESYFEKDDFITLDDVYSQCKAVDVVINNAKSKKPENMRDELEKQLKKSKYQFSLDYLVDFVNFLRDEFDE